MGNGLFAVDGVDVQALLAQHMGARLLAATVQRYTEGGRTAGQLTGGKEQTAATPISCRGLWKSYKPGQIDGVRVLANHRMAVLLVGSGLSAALGDGELEPDTAITMEGRTMYVLRLQKRDPANAVHTYQCADRQGADKA